MDAPDFFTKVVADGSCRNPWLLRPMLTSTCFLPSCPSGLRWLSRSLKHMPGPSLALLSRETKD